MTSSPSHNVKAERPPVDTRGCHSPRTGAASRELFFFDGALDALQQEAVSRALGKMELLLIEAADAPRREAVLAELLRQMAFRGADVLVLRAEDCAQSVEVNGRSESMNNARLQWSNLVKLAEQAASIDRGEATEDDVASIGQSDLAPRLSLLARVGNWLRIRRRLRNFGQESQTRLQGLEESWVALCEQLTGVPISPPSLSAVSEWHRHMCSTETADDLSATWHDASNHRVDIMVLLDAERLDDETLTRLAAKSRQVIMFGVLPAADPADVSAGAGQDTPEFAAAFGRLWLSMQNPRVGARYRWVEQAGSIACRVEDYPYDSTYVERERVADQPEIELRIDAPPHGSPRLVEIAFPRGQGIEACKQFAYRELEHLAFDVTGKAVHWSELSGHITVELSPVSSEPHRFIEIAPGVREHASFVKCVPAQANAGRWITGRVEFDRRQGWDRAKAENWLKAQSGFWNDERVLSLETATCETGGTPVPQH